ncbi:MAG TPA: aminoacetone oxidase family FAD-binding enzyme [Nitrospiraceae bacterium]|jgi:predicted Rossmann fold flavoprotein|nr:aminoacetone oxidase family FAD-binding enzyme [Nitrospiraceae bacterium]
MKRDVVIIGAGASGLLCAIESAKRGRSVSVLDHAERVGNKIRISGGGRCNFTNIHVSYEEYASQNLHFCKSALARFTSHDFITLLEQHRIKYVEKENGQLFCNKNSLEIVHMLEKECSVLDVQIRLRCRVSDIRKTGPFIIATDQGTYQSESLVIATGGLSFPELGATGFGHRLAKHFGLKITPLKPALVPLLWSPQDLKLFSELSGISIDSTVSCNGKRFRGNMLFTHPGLSGPAILQCSLYWKRGETLVIDLLPERDAYELFVKAKDSKMEMHNRLSEFLPRRFLQKWFAAYCQSKPIRQYTVKELKDIAYRLHHWEITPKGTEGYRKAEVTLGGVDTDELSSKTLEAKKLPGLYFVGEVIDVTGQLGGYNLQWAWSSGYTAGQYA